MSGKLLCVGSGIEKIPQYLRKLRERCDFTQRYAAYEADLTTSAVAFIERGERQPRIDTLIKLLDAYGTSLEQLAVDLDL